MRTSLSDLFWMTLFFFAVILFVIPFVWAYNIAIRIYEAVMPNKVSNIDSDQLSDFRNTMHPSSEKHRLKRGLAYELSEGDVDHREALK